MSCADVDRWLDDGMPAGGATVHLAHAATCPRCAAAIEAAREIDALLDSAAFATPPEFTDHVMARIADASRVEARAPSPTVSPLAWWVRAAADPASVLALVVAGLVVWKVDALLRVASLAGALAQGSSGVLLAWLTFTTGWLRAFGEHAGPTASLGIAMVALPATAWMSWALFRWTERRMRFLAIRRHGV